MKLYSATFLYVTIFIAPTAAGCAPVEGPVAAIRQCSQAARVDRCSQDGPGAVAYCYDEGEIGPQPFLSGGDRPVFDCAAPEEDNIVGPAPWYFRNWWCCGSRGCTPGSEIACTVDGGPGVAYCDGSGLNIGACIPVVSPTP